MTVHKGMGHVPDRRRESVVYLRFAFPVIRGNFQVHNSLIRVFVGLIRWRLHAFWLGCEQMNDSIKSSDCGRLQAVGVDFRNDETLSRLIQYLTNSQHLTLTGSPTITEDGHALISFCNDEGLPGS